MIEELRETIKKYLKGQLSEAEKAAFEYRIANEPEVEKAVNIIRLERLSIDLMFENDLRQKMREWKAENEAKSASKSIKRHKVLKRFWLPICLF